MIFLEGSYLIVFYYLSASAIWPDQRGGLIREVAFAGSGLIREVTFAGSDLIREVAFGGSGLIRRGLLG